MASGTTFFYDNVDTYSRLDTAIHIQSTGTTSGVSYFGWAQPGLPTSEAGWAIKKIYKYASPTGTGTTEVARWATGSGATFSYIWDNHTTYNYGI